MDHSQWLLRNILWCGFHDRPYTITWADNRHTGEKYRYYLCNVGYKYPDLYGKCPCTRLKAKEIESALLEQLYDITNNPWKFLHLLRHCQEKAEGSQASESIARHEKRLEGLDKERGRLLNAYQKGYVSEPELDLKMKGLKEQEEYHRDEIANLSEEGNFLSSIIEFVNSCISNSMLPGWTPVGIQAVFGDDEPPPFLADLYQPENIVKLVTRVTMIENKYGEAQVRLHPWFEIVNQWTIQ
jgi:hypothetical protein